ncbi:MAG TPA: ferritin-like domain-containing protein [Silvibacterium sp.]|nr:ferritin-like domain-containing protein [Silvibacterium sp.]
MKLETLRELYIDELRDLYSAETQITKALPKLAKTAANPKLRHAFEEHLQQTKNHVQRLEQIFEGLEEKPTGKTCEGMKGLLKEGSEMAAEDGDSDVIDAGLISAAQRVEHYEIAGYGCVVTYAELLGEAEAADLLSQTLEEEKQTDQKLTQVAKKINVEAKAA